MEKHPFNKGKAVTILVALLSLLVVSGCKSGDAQAKAQKPETVLIALDTSESAREFHKGFFASITDRLLTLPTETHVEVYRFDSSPAEVYSGPPANTREEAALLIKRVLEYQSGTEGTNLARLCTLLDSRLASLDQSAEIEIYTDCGIELMSNEDRELVKEVTTKWAENQKVKTVRIIGLRDGFREDIRELVALNEDKLSLENTH